MRPDYQIHLQRVFQGPMDLLLHLVREQEVEIHEVEISRVITGFLEYVKALTELDIELAGDFTVMAATLMAIKSRSLLPQEEVDLEDELDPRDELIERLIEYRRFKETSDRLGEQHDLRARQFGRGRYSEVAGERPEPMLDLSEVTSWDLLATFSRLMRETLAHRPHHVRGEAHPLRFYVQSLAHRIRTSGATSLRALMRSWDELGASRESLIGSFCALLELVRLGLVSAEQDEPHDDIRIAFVADEREDLDDLIRSAQFDDEAAEVDELIGDALEAAPDAESAGNADSDDPDGADSDDGDGLDAVSDELEDADAETASLAAERPDRDAERSDREP